MHPRTLRKNGCCLDQKSFHQPQNVVAKNGLEWRAILIKVYLGGTNRLKKLLEQRKIRSKPCYRMDRHLICIPIHSDAKSGNFGSKEIQGEFMERVWSSVGFQLFFGKQRILEDHQRLRRKISRVTYSINDSTGNILTVENEILSRWKNTIKIFWMQWRQQLVTHKKWYVSRKRKFSLQQKWSRQLKG